MSQSHLVLEGARQNNLGNISLQIPHNQVVAVTGVSGSGKSSLAFDTIFAEGQWRFIESLSTYARLFLEKLDRPDADAIRNIRPAIALEQKNPVRGARSTVGTLTEIYDLFRLLYAKIATPFCPQCGREIRKWDPAQIAASLLEAHAGARAVILFESSRPLDELIGRGFRRFWVNGAAMDSEELEQGSTTAPPFRIVLDRLVLRDEPRLSDSLEMAWKEGGARLAVVLVDAAGGQTELLFSAANSCEACSITLPEPTALLFSFNHPVGACPTCKGYGDTLRYDENLIIPDRKLSLAKGAVEPWSKPAARWWKRQLSDKGKKAGLDLQKPYEQFDENEKRLLFEGGAGFYGINDFFEDLEGKRYKLHVRVFLSRYRRGVRCPSCNGKRLKPEALAYRVAGRDIADLCSLAISGTAAFFEGLDLTPWQRGVSKELVRHVMMKLSFLRTVGLDYLALDRPGKTLSGGEYQRINLSNQLASQLTGTLYVLDEPTVGLHPRDTDRISVILRELAGLGNTVIVVEHDQGIIAGADWIVELGPGGGHKGGQVVFEGPREAFLRSETLTAQYLKGALRVAPPVKSRFPETGALVLRKASGHNLKDVDVAIPLNRFTVVSGVSGSGKSSLVVETLYRAVAERFRPTDVEQPLAHEGLEGIEHLAGVNLIDQSPIGKSPRSNPATYLKVFDSIRKLFSEQREAKAYGYGPGFFSFNIPGGRCEACRGEGYEMLEMYFFEDLYVRCEKCDGKRYRPEALRVHYRGKTIHDVLGMTVEEAAGLFSDQPAILQKLSLMLETGLGYLRLGQPATTLSGGEAQRLKICAELGRTSSARQGRHLYILDEPTVGLHFADVQALLNVLNRLVDSGNTVVVIEHNLDVIKAADWVIDMGPEGGASGGRIVFQGNPEALCQTPFSHTGRYLEAYLSSIEKTL
ncbi:MAG: excinuclease ABC subunit UvrA [Thermodesulfovibrionales bacterium]